MTPQSKQTTWEKSALTCCSGALYIVCASPLTSRQWGSSETGSGIFQLCHQSVFCTGWCKENHPWALQPAGLARTEPRLGATSPNSPDPTTWTSNHHPGAAADRVTLTSSPSVWVFSASPPQGGIPTHSCSHKTPRHGPAEPRAAPKALNAVLARLGPSTPSAIPGC